MTGNSISVYQPLAAQEKPVNYSAHPELVYSRFSNLALLTRQLSGGGVGILFYPAGNSLATVQQLLGDAVCIIHAEPDNHIHWQQHNEAATIVAIAYHQNEVMRVATLQQIARQAIAQQVRLKWITVLDRPHRHQLFKWDLRFN